MPMPGVLMTHMASNPVLYDPYSGQLLNIAPLEFRVLVVPIT